MNGEQSEIVRYLQSDKNESIKTNKDIQSSSAKKNSTEIFIETPYRNNQLIETLLKTCKATTRICIASELTGTNEFVKTKTVADWQKEKIDFHKKPVIFLLQA
jgi:16S rRNA (cytidine1402-2'-O)-methyltransferase